MKHISKYLLLFVVCLKGYSQNNYVFNGDFESVANQNYNPGNVNDLNSWECRTVKNSNDPTYYHSPDLYSAAYAPNIAQPPQLGVNVTSPTPHNGSNMVGMQPYELIQQRFLNQNMIGGQYYTCSAYIWLASDDPTWWQDNALQFWIATSRTDYKSENGSQECSVDYITYSTGVTHSYLGSVDLSLSAYPAGQWHKVSFTFLAPPKIDTDWGWFGIEQIKPNYHPTSSSCPNNECQNCYGGYMFIDDVSIVDADLCGANCAPTLGQLVITCPTLSSSFPKINGAPANNGVIALCSPWWFTVKNAISIDFRVYDRPVSGNLMYHQSAFNVNGLINPGYSDYWFGWLGEVTPGQGNTFPQVSGAAVFTYELDIINCVSEMHFASQLTYVVGHSGCCLDNNGAAVDCKQYSDQYNPVLNDCCPQNLYFQNTTFTGTDKYGADQYIYVGKNVTTGTQGPVIVDPGADVTFIAGTQVVLQPGGYNVLPGGNLRIKIGDCASTQRIAYAPSTRDNIFSTNDNYNIDSLQTNARTLPNNLIEVHLIPNPSNGEIYISTNTKVDLIEVCNMNGGKVFSSAIRSDDNKINLSSLNDGVYFAKIYSSNILLKTEKIVIVK